MKKRERFIGSKETWIAVLVVVFLVPLYGVANSSEDELINSDRHCTATAEAIFRACGNEAQDDYWITTAKCINVSDDAVRAECRADARDSLDESSQLCRQQFVGRRNTCKAIGEERYDPDFDPTLFEDDFANLASPNRYFPLKIGNRWEYRGGTEFNTLEVLNKTKLIDGIRCVVLRDIVKDEGDLVEATDDWYAQARDGNVWYCGEEVKDYESFEGDRPIRPELVSIDGSFKAGRDGDKGGIIFLARPKKGDVYIEEFSLGNAEDVTEISSAHYAFGNDPQLDHLVPQQLAQLFCSGDCVVTKNYSLLEPGIFARKYYAPEIGVFLEVESTGEVHQLVKCNFDSRCEKLPAP